MRKRLSVAFHFMTEKPKSAHIYMFGCDTAGARIRRYDSLSVRGGFLGQDFTRNPYGYRNREG